MESCGSHSTIKEVGAMSITAKQMASKYRDAEKEYKDKVIDIFYTLAVWGFIAWDEYIKFIKSIEA